MRCPGCDTELNSHTVVSKADVEQGKQATICGHCATISVFTLVLGRLALREAHGAQLQTIINKPEVQAALAELLAAKADDPRIRVRLRAVDPQ